VLLKLGLGGSMGRSKLSNDLPQSFDAPEAAFRIVRASTPLSAPSRSLDIWTSRVMRCSLIPPRVYVDPTRRSPLWLQWPLPLESKTPPGWCRLLCAPPCSLTLFHLYHTSTPNCKFCCVPVTNIS
jgi:hypothetical protein